MLAKNYLYRFMNILIMRAESVWLVVFTESNEVPRARLFYEKVYIVEVYICQAVLKYEAFCRLVQCAFNFDSVIVRNAPF